MCAEVESEVCANNPRLSEVEVCTKAAKTNSAINRVISDLGIWPLGITFTCVLIYDSGTNILGE